MALLSPKSWFNISTCRSYPLSLKSAIPYFVLSLPLFFFFLKALFFHIAHSFLFFLGEPIEAWITMILLFTVSRVWTRISACPRSLVVPMLVSSLLKLSEAWILFIILLLVLALFWLSSLTTLQNFTLTVLSKISLSYVNWE